MRQRRLVQSHSSDTYQVCARRRRSGVALVKSWAYEKRFLKGRVTHDARRASRAPATPRPASGAHGLGPPACLPGEPLGGIAAVLSDWRSRYVNGERRAVISGSKLRMIRWSLLNELVVVNPATVQIWRRMFVLDWSLSRCSSDVS